VVDVSAGRVHVRYINAHRGPGEDQRCTTVSTDDILRVHTFRLNRSMIARAKFHANAKFPGAAPDAKPPITVARITNNQYRNILEFFAQDRVTGILKAKKTNVKRGSELELQQIPSRLWLLYLRAYPEKSDHVCQSTFFTLTRLRLFQVKKNEECVCEMCLRFGIDGFSDLGLLLQEMESDFDTLLQEADVEQWAKGVNARIKRT
jgi:hypothetical protein